MNCPKCGFDLTDYYLDEYWFLPDRGGTSFDGEYTSHWVEGTQTCPKCGHKFTVGDSD